MSTLNPAQSALAACLKLSEETFAMALQEAHAGSYHRYRIPKGDGRFREICAPSDAIKAAQRALLDELLSQVALSPYAHGFAPGRSIISNAKVHATTARAMLSVDLQDAFPSVSAARVRKTLEWRLGPLLRQELPTLERAERAGLLDDLSMLCTLDGVLPQGSPASGMLLNLCCARLDRQVARLLRRHRLPAGRYSRYADDLTITSAEPISDLFLTELRRAVLESGFKINPRKVHRHREEDRALVICGIRLHSGERRGELALPRTSLRRYRALFDHAISRAPTELSDLQKQQIRGNIAFLKQVYARCPRMLLKPLERLLLVHRSWLQPGKDRRERLRPSFTLYRDLQS